VPQPTAAGCAGPGRGFAGSHRSCPGTVVAAGLIHSNSVPLAVWLAFGCAAHVDLLVAPRVLLDRDRAELAARYERVRRTVEDKQPWVPPGPLAVGADARRLLARARRWAQTHPWRDVDDPARP
jgi:hypothetical protein